MIWCKLFLTLVCAVLLGVGCSQPESADNLFTKGEAATHRVSTYSQAEAHLSAFLTHYPNDSRADVALQALARILQSQGRSAEAIARYEELIRRFPDSRYADQAQFMIGYIHDQNGNYDQARLAYQKVLDRYAKSELVDDAKISIANLGKSLEDWLVPDSSAVGSALPQGN